jgi:hypothetical protein
MPPPCVKGYGWLDDVNMQGGLGGLAESAVDGAVDKVVENRRFVGASGG